MKRYWLAAAPLMLCACAGTYTHPDPVAGIVVTGHSVDPDCGRVPHDGKVLFDIANHGRRRVAFPLSDERQTAPFNFHQGYASLERSLEIDGEYGVSVRVLEHYFPASKDVTVTPGDGTTFALPLYVFVSPGDAREFYYRIRLMDRSRAIYRSAPFRLCSPAPGA